MQEVTQARERENKCDQGQTQTKHEWAVMGDGDGRNRQHVTSDDASDSLAFTGGDVTKYRALVARISHSSQDRPDLKFTSTQVCCAMAKLSVRDMERAKRIGSYFKATRRSVSAGVIVRGGHWRVVSLSTAESELHAAVKTASEGLWVEPTSGRLSDEVSGQPQRIW